MIEGIQRERSNWFGGDSGLFSKNSVDRRENDYRTFRKPVVNSVFLRLLYRSNIEDERKCCVRRRITKWKKKGKSLKRE